MGWKISDLQGASLPLTGAELLEVTQGENSRSVRVMDLLPGFEDTLAADIASTTDAGKGAAMVGRGVVYVASYADIRALKKTSPAKVANFDGFIYRLDEADSTSAASIPRIVVAADGGRWKLRWKRELDITQYLETELSPMAEAMNRAFAIGGTLLAPDGLYTLNATVGYQHLGMDFPPVGMPSRRLTFHGESMGNTIFEVEPGVAIGFKFEGGIGTGSEGGWGFDRISSFTVVGKARSHVPSGRTGVGIQHLNMGYSHMSDISAAHFDVGIHISGCLSNEYRTIYVRDNNIGLIVTRSLATLPNAISIPKLIATGNSTCGAYFDICGAGNSIKGGSVEGNGSPSSVGPVGLSVNCLGDNGLACLSVEDQYFESNAGDCDSAFDNMGTTDVVVHISNTQFHRLSNAWRTRANIRLRSTGGGKLTLILGGNGFISGLDYTPTPERPFIDVGANCFVQGWETCVMTETVSQSGTNLSSLSRAVCGSVSCPIGGPLTILNAPYNTIVTRINPGEYTVRLVGGFASHVDAYTANVIPTGLVAGVRIAYIKKISADTFQFAFNGPTPTGPYQDSDFSFTVFKQQ